MTTTPPPLPALDDPLTAPHWQAAREGRLAMQRCRRCAHVRWPAARACPECLEDGGVWETLSGRGRIRSLAVYPEPLHPAFAADCPYAVALVTLDEGPTLYARMEEDPVSLACDQRVLVVFREVAPGVSLPRFRLEPVHGR